MPINSKNKGKVGELEFVELLKKKGLNARRGQQFCGANGDADVVCEELNYIHFEVKRTQALNFNQALAKAKSDAKDGKIPVVMHRRNHGDWVAILDANKLLNILIEISRFDAIKKFEKERYANAYKVLGIKTPYEKILDDMKGKVAMNGGQTLAWNVDKSEEAK